MCMWLEMCVVHEQRDVSRYPPKCELQLPLRRLGEGKEERVTLLHGLMGLNIPQRGSISTPLMQRKCILKKVSVGGEHMGAAGADQTHLSSTAGGRWEI